MIDVINKIREAIDKMNPVNRLTKNDICLMIFDCKDDIVELKSYMDFELYKYIMHSKDDLVFKVGNDYHGFAQYKS